MLQHGNIAHFSNYAQQGAMCAGDLIMESAPFFSSVKRLERISERIIRERYRGQRPVLVDRWGFKHQCWSLWPRIRQLEIGFLLVLVW